MLLSLLHHLLQVLDPFPLPQGIRIKAFTHSPAAIKALSAGAVSSELKPSHYFRKTSHQGSCVPHAAASGGYGMGKTPGNPSVDDVYMAFIS